MLLSFESEFSNIETLRVVTCLRQGNRFMFKIRNAHLTVVPALITLAAGCLTGCIGTAGFTSATIGVAAMEERGLSGTVDDTILRIRINTIFSDNDERLWRKVGLQVHSGRVLLTGALETAEMRLKAVRLVWQADGVREVINEIQITSSNGLAAFARDTWISTRLKSELLFDGKVSSINYSIETVNGTVYLIGVAKDKKELERVINRARALDYVKKVVSYVKFIDKRRAKP